MLTTTRHIRTGNVTLTSTSFIPVAGAGFTLSKGSGSKVRIGITYIAFSGAAVNMAHNININGARVITNSNGLGGITSNGVAKQVFVDYILENSQSRDIFIQLTAKVFSGSVVITALNPPITITVEEM